MTYQFTRPVTLDAVATSVIVERLTSSADAAHRVASRVDDALETLVSSGSPAGAPGVAAALSSFAHARVGTGETLAAHLDSVATSTRAAVDVLTRTDEAVASRSEALL